jgi:hypothetical protein
MSRKYFKGGGGGSYKNLGPSVVTAIEWFKSCILCAELGMMACRGYTSFQDRNLI